MRLQIVALFFILACASVKAEEAEVSAPAAPEAALEEPVRLPPKHLLEIGIGGGAGYSPDYPGAEQGRMHYVPFPILYFHGKILRSDREDGARARVVHKPIFGIDVSGSGAFPIKSEENRLREGMPDLEWLGETGPRLWVRLADRRGQLWRAFLAGRAAFSTNMKRLKDRGQVLVPGIGFEHKHFLVQEVSHFAKLSVEFASQGYNDYFYSVAASDARPDRPEYHAKAGYVGTFATSGLTYETHDLLVSGGLSLMFHDGSANRFSPLFRNEFNFGIFFGMAYFFYHSKKEGYL